MIGLNKRISIAHIDVLDILLLGFALLSSSFSFLWMGLYLAVPILTVRCFSRGCSKIFSNRQVRIYSYLILWIFLTNFLGEDIEKSLFQFRVVLASWLVACSSYYLARNANNMKALCFLYVLFYASLLYYVYLYGEIGVVTYDEGVEDRGGGTSMNANNFAYYLPFLTLSLYYLYIDKSKKWLMILAFFVFNAAMSFYVSLLTASRQVLIMQIPLVAFLMFLKFKELKGKFIVQLALLAVIATMAIPYVTNIYDNSFLAKRSEMSLKDDHRIYALQNAIKVGSEHIVFGVGTGNYVRYDKLRNFTHNSYAELFACTGLLGVILYIMIFVTFLKRQITLYKRFRKQDIWFCVIAILIYLLQNIFYVYYLVPWLMAFPYIIIGYSDGKYSKLHSVIKRR